MRNSPSSCFTRSRIPAIPMPRAGSPGHCGENMPAGSVRESFHGKRSGFTKREEVEPVSELKDWKNAEHDLLVTMPIDQVESEGNFYALASVSGYAAAEISVAVEDCWLLISGWGYLFEQTGLGAHDAEVDSRGATSDARPQP
jgi:hypothetical protein